VLLAASGGARGLASVYGVSGRFALSHRGIVRVFVWRRSIETLPLVPGVKRIAW